MKATKQQIFSLFSLLLFTGMLVSCNQKENKKTETTAVTITGKETYADTATSSIKVFNQNGKVCIQQSNTYFEIVSFYEGKNKIPLLVKIKKTSLCEADSANREKVFEIEAKSVLDNKSIEWQTNFVATQIEFRDNIILALKEGGEDEEDLLTRFSLLDGKQVFIASYSDMKIVIPNVREKRFIGFVSQKATTKPIQNLKEENLLGIINYATGSAPINSVSVKLKRNAVAAKIPLYTPDMVLVPNNANTSAIEDGKSIVLMNTDEHFTAKDVSDFNAKFTFYYGDDNEATEIIIPIKNDKLDISKAVFDKDIFEITAR